MLILFSRFRHVLEKLPVLLRQTTYIIQNDRLTQLLSGPLLWLFHILFFDIQVHATEHSLLRFMHLMKDLLLCIINGGSIAIIVRREIL
jgi:hypothetical protein